MLTPQYRVLLATECCLLQQSSGPLLTLVLCLFIQKHNEKMPCCRLTIYRLEQSMATHVIQGLSCIVPVPLTIEISALWNSNAHYPLLCSQQLATGSYLKTVISSSCSHHISQRYVLILSSYLCLVLLIGPIS